MEKNVGTADRAIRIIVGLALIALPFISGMAMFDGGMAKIIAIAIGAILIGTAKMQFCPLYRIVGIKTCKV